MLLTDQASYQKADYLRDYQKYYQYRKLFATEVFYYCALHLSALTRLPKCVL